MANISRSRKSGVFLRNGVARRETLWIEAPPIETVIAAASTAVLIGRLLAASLALRPFTIVRTRGILYGRSDQSAATENWGGAYGIAVVSEQADAIGITALPTPVTDMDSDLWLLYEQMYGRIDFDSSISVREVGFMKEIDSKAMRKVVDGQQVVVTAETPAHVSSWGIVDGFRMLLKLH